MKPVIALTTKKFLNRVRAHGLNVRCLFAAIVIAVIGISCATSPTGRKQVLFMPDSQMNTMGAQAFAEMKAKEKVDTSATNNNYVKCIANAITSAMAEQRSWEVVVFLDDSPNAFALPGGKIGVHTGMLKVATTPDQLAAVIGHEVGHVIARHGNERVSEQFAAQGGLSLVTATFANKGPKYDLLITALGIGTQYGLLLPHSRTQESEADVIGLELMAKAGFDPRQSVELWKNMAKAGGGQPPEFLSTHPSHGRRIDELTAGLPAALEIQRASGRNPNCRR